MSTEYYLYIDDSGNRFPDRQSSESRLDGMDHFALGGILLRAKDKKMVEKLYISFCAKWDISYPLHSNEIRGMRDNFGWLEQSSKQKENFLDELHEFLASLPVIAFAAVVHRPGYNERYMEKYGRERWWMCKTAYAVLIERVVKFVKSKEGKLHVRYEECGTREDRAILQYSKAIKSSGSPFDPTTSDKYCALTAGDYEEIILGEPRRKTKDNLFVQIADMYLFPMAKRGYNPEYRPWKLFFENNRVIDALLPEEEWDRLGIKYSCFGSTK